MAHLVHPRPQRGRQKAFGQIVFHDGHADFDLTGHVHLEQALRQHGFVIEETSESESAERPSKGSKGSKVRKPVDAPIGADTPHETAVLYVSAGLDEQHPEKTDEALAAIRNNED